MASICSVNSANWLWFVIAELKAGTLCNTKVKTVMSNP